MLLLAPRPPSIVLLRARREPCAVRELCRNSAVLRVLSHKIRSVAPATIPVRAVGEHIASQMRSGSPAPSGPIPSLDGIRAISVALVFFSHNGLGNVVPGGLGVTIFFVLSGFLITTLMRGEFAETGTVSFRAFYLRRFLRLIPPLLVVTCISVAAFFIAGLGDRFTAGGLASVLLYFSNYFQIFHGASGQPPGLGVTWSLAVEEHYYLLYPPLAVALLRFGRPTVSAALLAL